MPLPQGFSEWEHFQSVLMQTQNRIVREAFEDIQDTVDDDITAPRSALRWACLLKDDDSAALTQLRLWMFYGVLRKARDFHPAMFTIPSTAFQSQRKYKPQIHLFFAEDLQDVEPGYDPVYGEISFRLMNQETETLTMTEVTTYANRVKNNFGAGTGFIWRKGKGMYSYTDWNKGYQLQLLCRDETEARRVIEQVLDIQGHTPDWKRFNENKNAEPASRYPTIPPTIRILGRNEKMPRERPIADVRFQYALLHLHGKPQPLILYDRTRHYRDPVVPA